jgi:hypothetical protein
MGHLQAVEFANSELDIEQQLTWHLRANHFPPAPSLMVPVCRDVILWLNQGKDINQHFALPAPSTWRGEKSAPAWAIAEAHHLEPWLNDEEF